jgi:hypothetical protein
MSGPQLGDDQVDWGASGISILQQAPSSRISKSSLLNSRFWLVAGLMRSSRRQSNRLVAFGTNRDVNSLTTKT